MVSPAGASWVCERDQLRPTEENRSFLSTCLLFVERERIALYRSVLSKGIHAIQASGNPELLALLANCGLLVIDPMLVSAEELDAIAGVIASWHVVADVEPTTSGLLALWEMLRLVPANVVLRHLAGSERMAAAVAGRHCANDELLRASAPMLSRLPTALSVPIAAVMSGSERAESVSNLAAMAGHSRRWVELHLISAGIGSAWRLVSANRIAQAHRDLINPFLRTAEIAQRHRFGSARTLRSQIEKVAGVPIDVVRCGMAAKELGARLARRLQVID
jgi:hypothetical protein